VSVDKGSQSEFGLIIKNAGLDVFGQAFNIVFSFVASIIITRTIGPELFGTYSLASSIFQVLCILAIFGMNRGVVRLTSKYMALGDTARVKGTLVSGVVLTSILSIALVGITALVAPSVARRFYSQVTGLELALRVYIIGLPFFTMMLVFNGYTQGFKTLKPSVIVEMIARPVARLVLILLLFLAGLRLFAVVLGGVGAIAVAAVIALIYAVKVSPFDFRKTRSKGVANELFFYSLPLVLANFMNVLISRSNVMISGYYLDSETVGILSATLVLSPFVSISLMSFSKIFAPIISELWETGNRLELMTHFKSVSKWIFTLSLPVFCVYLLFAPGILSIFGNDFPNGASALVILAIGQIVNAVVGPIGFILTMTGRQKLNLVNSICLAGSNVALNLIFIPKYGMNGAALATTLSIASTNILRVVEVKILYGFTPFRYDLAKPVAAGAVTSAAFYFLNRHFQWTGIFNTVGLCIAFAALYILMLYGLGLKEEREVLREVLKRKKK